MSCLVCTMPFFKRNKSKKKPADTVQTVSIQKIDEVAGKYTSSDGAPPVPRRTKDSKGSEGSSSLGSAMSGSHHDGSSGSLQSPHPSQINGSFANATSPSGARTFPGQEVTSTLEPVLENSIADPNLPPHGSSKLPVPGETSSVSSFGSFRQKSAKESTKHTLASIIPTRPGSLGHMTNPLAKSHHKPTDLCK
ncbi:unnamed protein product [Orchesella dallaii]|uniref:Uncharacterized protein n=1 Tax=Orchesella dallaii TaxID=48710 RepID=A0ABP1RSG8_9HEXA